MTQIWRHALTAFNAAAESDNKIHDDALAARFGFSGGLVPGVEVFAYMSRVALDRFGPGFLSGGRMAAQFAKPVYDGDGVSVSGTETADGALELLLSARDVVCASGRAAMGEAGPVRALPSAPAPVYADAPAASAQTLAPGRVLGTLCEYYMAETGRPYLDMVGETHPAYLRGRVAHPGFLLRRANFVLAYNVRLGPWIHTGSDVTFHSPLRDGEPFETRAVVAENVERKGHLTVALDIAITAAGRFIMSGRHMAIWEPRQVREMRGAP